MEKGAEKPVQVAVSGVTGFLTYFAPKSCNVGDEVEISIFRAKRQGWIVHELDPLQLTQSIADISRTKTKNEEKRRGAQLSLLESDSVAPDVRIKSVSSSKIAFTANQIKLFQWISDYYGCELHEVLATALPPRTKKSRQKVGDEALPVRGEISLTSHQQQAVEKLGPLLSRKEFSCSLIHGVTGSGKTEVYIRLIQQSLESGKAALVIVPEIALTPQLLQQFTEGLGTIPAVLHSQLAKAERWTAWNDLLSGRIKVAIGARSAVFAPLIDLGLIIVDEEHDGSYKQSDSLRYNARDVAIARGKIEHCAVVLGSATPSFESLRNAYGGKYTLVELPERALSRPLPKIELINLREIRRKDMISENISPPLFKALTERLERREQVVVLYNRRGFATYLQCVTCDEVISCPHCSVALTYHLSKKKLICHHCGHADVKPHGCPICTDTRVRKIETAEESEKQIGELKLRGSGTERVVEELELLFPSARIVRLDRDVAAKKGHLQKVLAQMKSGEADILVGTQMVAKGHDIHGVTLVAIIDADVGLHLPDFRSSERTYQLIAQASGRAGRGIIPGEVVVQTRFPNHPTLVAVANDRFKAFARYEFEFRKKLKYPPHFRLMRIVVSAESARDAEKAAQLTAETARDKANEIRGIDSSKEIFLEVVGPSPAPFEKLRGRYRFHMIVKSSSARSLSQLAGFLNRWKRDKENQKKLAFDFRVTTDVDPVDML